MKIKQIFKKGCLIASIMCFPGWAQAQQVYSANQSEFIFSLAEMNSSIAPTSPVLRFSGFTNHEMQFHMDFGNTIGMFSGLGIRNIGMINRFDKQGVNFKQRAYALGLPLAVKIGNMDRQAYIALGGEINLMTHYKEKFLFEGTKIKSREWFSDKVNLLNPAVFLQIKFMEFQVITFKYFLLDFLRYQSDGLLLPDGTLVGDYGRSSKLFYISWGTNIANRNPVVRKQQQIQRIQSARWIY